MDEWQRRALFVADNPDPAGNFPVLSDEIISGYLPSDLAVTRAYLPGQYPGTPATAEQIVGNAENDFRHHPGRRSGWYNIPVTATSISGPGNRS